MCIATTKKAAGHLQKILKKLGEFGRGIETDIPALGGILMLRLRVFQMMRKIS